MARGKYVDTIYRTGTGIVTHRVTATLIGGDVEVEVPTLTSKDAFISVREINRGKETVQEARFARTEVVAIIDGQLPPQKSRARK
jgi:hypothetical protein